KLSIESRPDTPSAPPCGDKRIKDGIYRPCRRNRSRLARLMGARIKRVLSRNYAAIAHGDDLRLQQLRLFPASDNYRVLVGLRSLCQPPVFPLNQVGFRDAKRWERS